MKDHLMIFLDMFSVVVKNEFHRGTGTERTFVFDTVTVLPDQVYTNAKCKLLHSALNFGREAHVHTDSRNGDTGEEGRGGSWGLGVGGASSRLF